MTADTTRTERFCSVCGKDVSYPFIPLKSGSRYFCLNPCQSFDGLEEAKLQQLQRILHGPSPEAAG